MDCISIFNSIFVFIGSVNKNLVCDATVTLKLETARFKVQSGEINPA